jgi:hypothetical protein
LPEERQQARRDDADHPSGSWTCLSPATGGGPTGVSANTSAIPSAVGLSSGAVLAAIGSDTSANIVTVQRFPVSGTPTLDLQVTGYSMPTLASDGVNVWIVMIRASDGYVVSRTFSPLSGWSPTDRVEIGAEGGGNHSWPNALRETDGRLRFVIRGPSGDADRAAVLAFHRPT